jgi:hypothetical protein
MAAKTLEFSYMYGAERDRSSCRTLGMTSKSKPTSETTEPTTDWIEPCTDRLANYLADESEKEESPPKS